MNWIETISGRDYVAYSHGRAYRASRTLFDDWELVLLSDSDGDTFKSIARGFRHGYIESHVATKGWFHRITVNTLEDAKSIVNKLEELS